MWWSAVIMSRGVPMSGEMAPVKLLSELTAPMLTPCVLASQRLLMRP